MSKGRDAKKNVKKEPLLTAKEKKKPKDLKKLRGFNFIILFQNITR